MSHRRFESTRGTLEPRLDRRRFMKYAGAGVTAAVAARLLGPLSARGGPAGADAAPAADARGWCGPDGSPLWKPAGYPVPIPGDGGSAATDAARLATFTVEDRLRLPEGFRYDVLAQWGDTLGPPGRPDAQVRFGYNADYTGLVPVDGAPGEFWLLVNHETISARPWLQGFESVHGPSPVHDGQLAGLRLLGASLDLLDPQFAAVAKPELLEGVRRLCGAAMSDLGVSVLRVRRDESDGTFEVVKESADHFRFTGTGSQNVPRGPEALTFTGPAAALPGRPRGTFSNCSGAVTPWGTFLSCEENFQDQVPEFVTPEGKPLPGDRKDLAGIKQGDRDATGLPFEFEGLGTGLAEPHDGRQFGWVCEVDPVNRTLKKHTALGRFRHENVALRVEAGKHLAAYMGDDRRGGHVWKFVSDEPIMGPKDKASSRLLEKGTLYVARLNKDFSGRWVPVTPETAVSPARAHYCAKGIWLPRRPGGGHVNVRAEGYGGTIGDGHVLTWKAQAAAFAGRHFDEFNEDDDFDNMTLGDLVAESAGDNRLAVVLLDAYAMANAAGGTPCARPEDIEVHPIDRSVYVAFTDCTGADEGSPDTRIFPDSAGKNSRQYGAIYRIAEDGDDPAATTFKWGRFVSSGEVADDGGGFACADNLCFDPAGNLWMVCDITTPSHNFPVTRDAEDATGPGAKKFPGVFGNNALFMIPTAGPHAGVPYCFAVGPCECELTGPTFTADGRTLLLSVQHPGELYGTRGHPGVNQPAEEQRAMRIAARDGALFTQQRTVPLGSNFPSTERGRVPRPCVVAITRNSDRRGGGG